MHRPKVIAVVGPTSSGKTALGIYLAKKLRGEVISADSRQVYKGLNLGTGKVTKKEMAGIPHHLLDVASPTRQFSASDFVKLSEKAIKKITSNKHIPIIVGGTGFYTDTLLGRMVIPAVPPNEHLREQLEKKTIKQLFSLLQKLDPRRAASIEPDHKRRLIRAIEIAKAVGSSPVPDPVPHYEVLWIGIKTDPRVLSKRISLRLRARIRQGMIAEAKKLHSQGLTYKRMEALGLEYRSLARFLKSEVTKNEMVIELDRAIGNYAKRQLRWFKRNQEIRWVTNKTQAYWLAKAFVSGYYRPVRAIS